MANFRWTWMYVSKKVDSADYPVGINLMSKINSKQKILSEQFANRETLLKSQKLTKSQLMVLTTTIFHIFKSQSWQEHWQFYWIERHTVQVMEFATIFSWAQSSKKVSTCRISRELDCCYYVLSIWKASGHTKTFPIALFTPLT